MSDMWGSDVPISMPQPLAPHLRNLPMVPMGGFTFTVHGLAHDITQADLDQFYRSRFEPVQPSTIQWGDSDL